MIFDGDNFLMFGAVGHLLFGCGCDIKFQGEFADWGVVIGFEFCPLVSGGVIELHIEIMRGDILCGDVPEGFLFVGEVKHGGAHTSHVRVGVSRFVVLPLFGLCVEHPHGGVVGIELCEDFFNGLVGEVGVCGGLCGGVGAYRPEELFGVGVVGEGVPGVYWHDRATVIGGDVAVFEVNVFFPPDAVGFDLLLLFFIELLIGVFDESARSEEVGTFVFACIAAIRFIDEVPCV